MKPRSTRVILYIKDIMKLTNKTYRASRHIAMVIKKKNGAQFVSIDAFCEYAGMRKETMREYLDENE